MQLINIDKLKKYYSDRLVLDIDKFEILENDKVGLVGANGVGKTTLIKILTGAIDFDAGSVYLTNSYSYISQNEDLKVAIEGSKVSSLLNAPEEFKEYLSGGEKVKIRIANALKEQKKLIIADEPTSNLDNNSIELLENMLKDYKGALFLVSHDRKFIDSLCTKIAELKDGKLKMYNGNYSTYLRLKEEERSREQFEYNQYITERKRLESSKLKKMGLRDSIKKAPKRMGNSEARLNKMGDQRAKKNIEGNIKAIQSRIDQLEVKDKPKKDIEIKINIKDGLEIFGKILVEGNNLNLLVEGKPLLNNVFFKIKRNKKIALIGDNGCGKTTLIKEILKNNNPNIRVNPRVRIGYFDQNQNILDDKKSILDNIKESSSFDETFIRINLNLFGFKGDIVYKKIQSLSGGERVKVALCKIILEDNNLLILDEPTNYLDIISIEALETALNNTEKTMIIVSHDREFVNKVCNYLIEIKNNNIVEFNGNLSMYEESKENYNKRIKTQKIDEEILLLENRKCTILSLLCIESNESKRNELENEFNEVLNKIKNVKY